MGNQKFQLDKTENEIEVKWNLELIIEKVNSNDADNDQIED